MPARTRKASPEVVDPQVKSASPAPHPRPTRGLQALNDAPEGAPVLYYVHMPTCGACQTQAPAVTEFAEAVNGKMKVYKAHLFDAPVRFPTDMVPAFVIHRGRGTKMVMRKAVIGDVHDILAWAAGYVPALAQ